MGNALPELPVINHRKLTLTPLKVLKVDS